MIPGTFYPNISLRFTRGRGYNEVMISLGVAALRETTSDTMHYGIHIQAAERLTRPEMLPQAASIIGTFTRVQADTRGVDNKQVLWNNVRRNPHILYMPLDLEKRLLRPSTYRVPAIVMSPV